MGQEIICPRDGKAGCAKMVDWIPREHRRQQTHFMSWTWKYKVQQCPAGAKRIADVWRRFGEALLFLPLLFREQPIPNPFGSDLLRAATISTRFSKTT